MRNFKIKINIFIFLNIFLNFQILSKQYDLTIIGYIKSADGIGSIPIRIMSCFKNYNLNINWINTRNHLKPELNKLPKYVRTNVSNGAGPSKIGIFTDVLWYENTHYYKTIPKKHCIIKFAYSMLEGSEIPKEWTNILNNEFDGVLVPDEFLISVYKNSGVKIPIFVLPLGLSNLNKFTQKKHINNSDIFIFGNTCVLAQRKNHIKLIEAFAKRFANNPKVKLIISSRGAEQNVYRNITNKIKELNLKNIELNIQSLSNKNYFDLINTFNCFVSLSQGEGFAIPPRECLALGIPVIISDNTAHSTICKTGFVKSVPSNIPIPATYFGFDNHQRQIGYSFDCSIEDASNALYEVYKKYNYYLKLANCGKVWVKQYFSKNLKHKYLSLINPKKILFGKSNNITEEGIITDSLALYRKYKKLFNR